MTQPINLPELSARPFHLTVERVMSAAPHALFAAWTRHFDRLVCRAGVGAHGHQQAWPIVLEHLDQKTEDA
jgi:hypothetical protein